MLDQVPNAGVERLRASLTELAFYTCQKMPRVAAFQPSVLGNAKAWNSADRVPKPRNIYSVCGVINLRDDAL